MLQHPIKSKGHDAMTDQLKDKQRNGKLRLKKWKEGQRIMWEKSRVRRILRRWTRGEGRWMVKSSGWADDSRPDYPPHFQPPSIYFQTINFTKLDTRVLITHHFVSSTTESILSVEAFYFSATFLKHGKGWLVL